MEVNDCRVLLENNHERRNNVPTSNIVCAGDISPKLIVLSRTITHNNNSNNNDNNNNGNNNTVFF